MQGIKSGLKLFLGSQTFPLRTVPELNVWEGRAAASFFFTWMVGGHQNKNFMPGW